jgi:predicted lipoprotein with Yx(FWY)xxD motif
VVLTNGQGHTLYAYAPEKGGKVVCVGGCASTWPPLALPSGQKPATSGHAQSSMVSSVANPSGGQIATYAGWPLHTYVSDSGPGSARGQGVGGVWHVISPAGTVVTKTAGSSSSGRAGGYGSGGSGY